jgi:GDP/UDP-N,N'-diacetylbacillosamine 2-epimerase (hydrolysing)
VGRSELKNILVLTSSRADFGIYLPLLKRLKREDQFELDILAFGTHLSKYHGYTLDQIKEAGFDADFQISSLVANDASEDVATSYALTALKFSDFWSVHKRQFDWVFVLGDRFEMAAAVAAGIPFNIPFVHIHGGETTLGAIDNIYRHFISLSSKLHFVALDKFQARIFQLFGSENVDCHVIGSLSLDNLREIKLISKEDFKKKWSIDLGKPSILITVHPETIAFEKNGKFALEVYKAFQVLSKGYQLIVTMPNADTQGSVFRGIFKKLKEEFPKGVFLIENFGTQSYFTCIKYAGLLIGNTSSGIIEAASFHKFVLNLGDRQKGRVAGENVIHLPFDAEAIIKSANRHFGQSFEGENIYDKGGAVDILLEKLKNHAANS